MNGENCLQIREQRGNEPVLLDRQRAPDHDQHPVIRHGIALSAGGGARDRYAAVGIDNPLLILLAQQCHRLARQGNADLIEDRQRWVRSSKAVSESQDGVGLVARPEGADPPSSRLFNDHADNARTDDKGGQVPSV